NFPHQDSSFKAIIDPSKEPPFNTQQSAAFNANVDSTLVSRLRALADRQQYSGTYILLKLTNAFHSFDTLLFHSLNDILTKLLIHVVREMS
ncbi:unnamed protein product, partial [Rotaria sordida]